MSLEAWAMEVIKNRSLRELKLLTALSTDEYRVLKAMSPFQGEIYLLEKIQFAD